MALDPMGRPKGVTRAVALVSPAASFITGANLVVDGALTRGVQFQPFVPRGAGVRGIGALPATCRRRGR